MRCEGCGIALSRPGDRCLTCGTRNADAVVAVLSNERARLTMLDGIEVRGETSVTTSAETAERRRERQRRNFVGRVADEIRRKRPDGVYVTGEHALIRRLRRALSIPLYRIDGPDPVAAYQDRRRDPPLAVVDGSLAHKLGGRHTSLIGDRRGRAILSRVAEHPHVKKIVPGPIESGGHGASGGCRAKVTRSDDRGNLRLLLREGSSVQTVRLITTAATRSDGRRIRAQLNDEIAGG